MTDMDELRTCLKKLRRENIHHRRFIPGLLLYRVVTKDAIQKGLKTAGIAAHQQEEIATRVVQNGKKIFAILTLIEQAADILKFIEADELQDAKLPFNVEILKDEIGIFNADEFDEKQWEVIAPTFRRGTLNRCLNGKIILPFTFKEDIGHGAFGKVWEIELDQDHQELDNVFPRRVSSLSLGKLSC
jgi:hypothetical protein